MENRIVFDNELYLKLQFDAFDKKQKDFDGLTFFEFGGKPFGDNHAARVLPGYDPDLKSKLLGKLEQIAKIVIAINARDILSYPYGRTLKGRIRGDTGLRYDDEVVRIINESEGKGFRISEVVLTCVPLISNPVIEKDITDFRKKISKCGRKLRINYEIENYPSLESLKNLDKVFEKNDNVSKGKNLIVVSPGGGSGKFGLILSEIYKSIKQGIDPNFIKFETFPVFKLGVNHPLNLAFEAASADQNNKVKKIKGGTNYNKDIENFLLLKELLRLLNYEGHLSKISSPFDWGVNVIEKGIIDDKAIISSCMEEIYRRHDRYSKEIVDGVERKETLDRVDKIIRKMKKMYNI